MPPTIRNPLNPADRGPLQILAVGDSVVWGNGLSNHNKFVVGLGKYVAANSQRNVEIYTFAHSGAKLANEVCEYSPLNKGDRAPLGDLSSGSPRIMDQLSLAANYQPAPGVALSP